MRPIQHPTNNAVLGAPPGVAIEDCKALAITRVVFEGSGAPAVRSYWQPSEAERRALAAGAPVCLQVWGTTHPPVALLVDDVEPEPW